MSEILLLLLLNFFVAVHQFCHHCFGCAFNWVLSCIARGCIWAFSSFASYFVLVRQHGVVWFWLPSGIESIRVEVSVVCPRTAVIFFARHSFLPPCTMTCQSLGISLPFKGCLHLCMPHCLIVACEKKKKFLRGSVVSIALGAVVVVVYVPCF